MCIKLYKTILLLLLLSYEVVATAEVYKVGILNTRGIDQTNNRWQPTLDYLTSELSEHSFQLIPLSLEKVANAVEKKRIDFLLTSSGQVASLNVNHNLLPLATLRNRYNRKITSNIGAVIITLADRDDIDVLSDLKGKSFAAVHKNSFSGFYMACHELKNAGIDPINDFNKINFLGLPYDDIVLAVKNKIVDAGTVRTGLLEEMAEKGLINLADFKIINKKNFDEFPFLVSTQLYPEWSFTALSHVPNDLKSDVEKTLRKMPANHANSLLSNHAGWSSIVNDKQSEDAINKFAAGTHTKEMIANTQIILIIVSIIALAITLYLVRTHIQTNSLTKTIVPASIFFLIIFSSVATVVATSFIEQHKNNIANNAKTYGKSLAEAFAQEIDEKVFLNKLVIAKYKIDILAGNGEMFPDELQSMALTSKKFSSDYRFLAIANEEGEIISIHGSREPGPMCKKAIIEFAKNSDNTFPDITAHGENGHFHFDSMAHVDGNDSPILFQSYDLNTLIKHFSRFENEFFEAVVINDNNLTDIAFSAEGVGMSLEFGETLDEETLRSNLFETSIPATNWRLVILPLSKPIDNYATKIYSYALAIVSSLILLFIVFLKRIRKEEDIRIALLQTTNTDELTGLPNRRYFEEHTEMALLHAQRNNEKLAILYIDLDGFKQVNDNFNHDAGDKVLQQVATVFHQVIRKNEFIARIGGDEFCLLVTNFNELDELRVTAERLIKFCSTSYKVNDITAEIGLSIGIAIYPKDGTNLQTLLSKADETMYQVKKHNKGSYAISGES